MERHPPSPPPVAPVDSHASYCMYEIVEAHAPPPLDLSKSLRQIFLPAWLIPLCTQWQRRYTISSGVVFILGYIPACGVLFARVPLGYLLSMLTFVMQAPLLVLGILALRTDMIKLLMNTFEFWFFTFANTVAHVLLGVCYGDLRALYLVCVWLGIQYNICVDSAVRGFVILIGSLAIGGIYHCISFFRISFSLIPDVESFRVGSYGPQDLSTQDLLLNTIGVLIYMVVRSIYRRSVMLFHHNRENGPSSDVTRVRCVSYRCAVKLRDAVVLRNMLSTTPSLSVLHEQMRLVPVQQIFDSRETILCGRNVLASPLRRWQKIVFHAVGGLGYSLVAIMFWTLNYLPDHTLLIHTGAILACVLSAVYCVGCFAFYQPGLLKYLCFSFDFVFLSAQFVFAHICAGYIFQWDLRVLVLVARFFWAMLLLTIDALTPVLRRKIGFQLWFILPVMVGSIVAQISMLIAVTQYHSKWRLRDDTIVQVTALGHEFAVHVTPAFINRMWMLTMWECRALWRILKASTGDLIIIRGAVDLDMSRRGRESRFQSVQVAPSPSIR